MGATIIDCLEHLPSGITVVYDDVPSVGTTALAFFVAVGSRDETPLEWGSAHFLEHLLFKGAGCWDYRAIAREMDRLGADINAFTTRDYTCFYARVLDSSALAAYRLLTTLVTEPWLSADDVVREKSVVVEEMRECQDDPDDVLDLLLTNSLYRDASYTHDILGTRDSLKSITADTLQAFFKQYYHPANMVFGVSGGARDAVLKALSEDFSDSRTASWLPRRRTVPGLQFGRQTAKADWEQLHIGLAVPAPGRYSPGYARALMTAGILGGQNSSRLWQRLREEEGLVYTVAAQYGPEDDFGEMSLYLSLGPESLDQALIGLSEELRKLADLGPDEDELERTRTSLYTMLVMGQETPDARIMRLGRTGLDQRLPLNLATTKEQFEQVKASLIQEEMHRWSRSDEIALAAAGPILKADEAITKFIAHGGLKHV